MDASRTSHTAFLRRLASPAALLAAAAVVWGCGDQNLFGPGEQQAPPEVVSLEVPDEVKSGQTMDVRVQAVASVPLDSIRVRVRGAFSEESAVRFDEAKLDATVDVSFAVPEEIADTTATVSAVAVDGQGNNSEIVSRSVRIIDTTAPQVGVTVASQTVALGNTLRVDVNATDNVGLREVGFRAFFTDGDTLVTQTAIVSGTSAENTFEYQVPNDVAEGDLTVEAFARDLDGNSATTGSGTQVQLVFVDEDPPTVALSLPDVTGGTVAVGDELLAHGDFTDNGGVAELKFQGLAFRGDPELGTDSTVVRFEEEVVTFDPVVADSLIKRLLQPVVSDSTSEDVHIIATATDGQGNVGADTVIVTVQDDPTAPTVDILQPVDGAGFPADDSVLVEVDVTEATDPLETGITSVLFEGVSFVGDRELGTFEEIDRYQPKEVTFDPPAEGTTNVKRFLVPTGDTTAATVYMRVTATDASGNQRKDSVAVQIGAPNVSIVTPGEGDSVSINSEITVRVEASDPNGIASLEVSDEGGSIDLGSDPLMSQTFSPAESPVTVEGSFNVGGSTGTIQVSALAVNSNGIEGNAGPITVQVVEQAAADDTPPELRVEYRHGGSPTDVRRVELTDTLDLMVEGSDNTGGTGVAKAGVTLIARPRDRSVVDSVLPLSSIDYATPRSGTFSETVSVPIQMLADEGLLDLLEAPDTVDLSLHAFMVDADGNCAAATSPTEFQSLVCGTLPVATNDTVADGVPGQPDFVVGVSGQTVQLPAGGSIADVAVYTGAADTLMILANIVRGRLEVFDLTTRTFESDDILVGAEPWGMTFSRTDGDSLYVANSGGTNLSVVDVPSRSEHVTRRIFTPNSLLWDVRENAGETGITFEAVFHDFSDRPQFIAQDNTERIVYSTRPTGSAPDGTIRLVQFPPPQPPTGTFAEDTVPEVILFTRHAEVKITENAFAVSNVDRVDLTSSGLRMRTRIPFHVPESGCTDAPPGHNLCTPFTATAGATDFATGALQDSVQANTENVYPDMFLPQNRAGTWDLESVGLSDTTFVAASGDGSIVALGEGATAPTGRIMLWNADEQDITDVISVEDLVGNSSEQVLGVDMNDDGTMGVGRGVLGTYFFDQRLRLQGTVLIDEGGGGVAFHPLHDNAPVGTAEDEAFAFVPVGDGRIDVINTIHFSTVGRVFIREVLGGPVRARLPFLGDNDGASCTTTVSGAIDLSASDGDCVAVKLFGTASDGGAVVVDVTVADMTRFAP